MTALERSMTTEVLKAKDPASCAYEAVKQRPKDVAFLVVLVLAWRFSVNMTFPGLTSR